MINGLAGSSEGLVFRRGWVSPGFSTREGERGVQAKEGGQQRAKCGCQRRCKQGSPSDASTPSGCPFASVNLETTVCKEAMWNPGYAGAPQGPVEVALAFRSAGSVPSPSQRKGRSAQILSPHNGQRSSQLPLVSLSTSSKVCLGTDHHFCTETRLDT